MSNAFTIEQNVENPPSLDQIQANNLALAEQMQDPRMNYGESRFAFASGGRYLSDIFNPNHIQTIRHETDSIFSREKFKHFVQKFNLQVEKLDTAAPEYLVFIKRTNLQQYPVPSEEYIGQPYLFDHPDESNVLNQESATYVNVPALVLATANVGNESWLYVRNAGVAGWIKNDQYSFIRGLKADEVTFDPLRPADSEKRFEEMGVSLGVITAYGLKDDGNGRLIPVGFGNANGQFNLQNREDFDSEEDYRNYMRDLSPEIFGDGILETGETALFSVGNAIAIVEEQAKYCTVQAPDGKKYTVDKRYINKGFLPATQQNMTMLSTRANGQPYSWGDGNGIDHDCSGYTSSLLSAFGIITPRGGDGQRYGLPGKEFEVAARKNNREDYNTYLPITLDDLREKGIDPAVIKWGFTTLSWGHHVVLMNGVDENGRIWYTHSVANMKDSREHEGIAGKNFPAIKLWRVVTAPGNNIGLRPGKLGTDSNALPIHTLSPALQKPTSRSIEVDRSRISMVIHV